MRLRSRSSAFLPALALACAALLSPASLRAAESPAEIDYAKFVADKSGPVVAVKFLLKMGGPFGGDEEQETEVSGIVIDPSGLVLCSNNDMGGFMGMMSRMMGAMGHESPEVSVVPKDIRVLVGNDPTEIPATLVARDTELDLAWIRVKDPGDRKFAHVDLSASVSPALGARVISVFRMDKYFDREPIFGEARIVGEVKKPRRLFVPMGAISQSAMAVHSADGALVGVTILQAPDFEPGMNPMSFAESMQSGVLILPAEEVKKATDRALSSEEEE